MAEINTVIAEASQDLQTIEDFVNLPAGSDVRPRLLPSVNVGTLAGTRQAIFEAGGLPATPFATKALMTASALVDGDYAMVTNDTIADNNGLYQKSAGAWVKSSYDPIGLLNAYKDEASYLVANSGDFSIAEYVGTGGQFLAAETTRRTPYISVVPNTEYIVDSRLTGAGRHAWYDSANVFISAFGGEQTTALTVISPSNAAFIVASKFTVNNSASIKRKNAGYNADKVIEIIDSTKLKDRLSAIEDSAVTYDDFALTRTPPTNIADSATAVSNMFIYSSTSSKPAGTVGSSSGTALRSFPVLAGKTYAIYIDDFKTNSSVVSYSDSDDVSSISMTTPATLIDTGDPKVKLFTVPLGMIRAFTNTLIPAYAYDIRDTIWVNEGTSIDNKPALVKEVGGNGLFDATAHSRIDALQPANQPFSALRGKSWVAIGDSITNKNYRSNLNYHDFVSSDVGGMDVHNYGISSTGFFDRYNMASTITQTTVDYITVFFGTNDWANNAAASKIPLGDFLDTGTATISGCINTLIIGLLTKFPLSKIAMFTPLSRLNNWGSNATSNSMGYTLEQLSELIIKYSKHYSLPYLDLYHNNNLNVFIPAANTHYFTAPSYPAPDGLHPNDAGQRVMADKIRPFLESI